MRHRSINRNSAVAPGSSFFNGWRSTPGTTLHTSQLALLISTTTTKVENESNAARLRLRSLTCGTGQSPSVRMDDEGATTSAASPHSFSHLGCVTAKRFSLRLPYATSSLTCPASQSSLSKPKCELRSNYQLVSAKR